MAEPCIKNAHITMPSSTLVTSHMLRTLVTILTSLDEASVSVGLDLVDKVSRVYKVFVQPLPQVHYIVSDILLGLPFGVELRFGGAAT